MGVTVEEEKARLRALAKERRAAAAEQASEAGIAVRSRFLAALAPPPEAVISGYWPIGSELDVRPLLSALQERGHPIALPVVTARGAPLTFRAWRPDTPLVPARFGLREPAPDQPVVVPDILIVPLLAFDRRGHRLGYGGGFYDRTLAGLRAGDEAARPTLAVGVAFAAQELDGVPHGASDERLDWVVTEADIIRID